MLLRVELLTTRPEVESAWLDPSAIALVERLGAVGKGCTVTLHAGRVLHLGVSVEELVGRLGEMAREGGG